MDDKQMSDNQMQSPSLSDQSGSNENEGTVLPIEPVSEMQTPVLSSATEIQPSTTDQAIGLSPGSSTKSVNKMLLMVIVVVLVGVTAVVGVMIAQKFVSSPTNKPAAAQQPTATGVETVMTTEEQEIDNLELGLDDVNQELDEIESSVDEL